MKVTVEEGERKTKQTRKGFNVETQIYISLCSMRRHPNGQEAMKSDSISLVI